MHIVFLLPGHGKKPIGGHKIVYQYANLFVEEGYVVSIIYGASGLFKKDRLKDKFKSVLRYVYFKITGDYKPYKWFNLDKKIKIFFHWNHKEKIKIKGDIYICTSIETAFFLNEYRCDASKKNYFIQGNEDWKWSHEMVIESYKFKMNKIVISNWLKELVEKNNEKATLVQNGFDFETFNLDIPIEKRKNTDVIMLFHTSVNKGVDKGFQALELVKREVPDLKVTLFGTFKKPDNLADWYSYYQMPEKEELRKLYNSSSVFIGPSIEEGWGLTVGESMQCGCAVACTDNKGFQAMAIHEKTALVSPVRDIETMAKQIIQLVTDNQLRFRIAQNGYKHIQNFDVKASYQQFKNSILKND